VHTGEAAARSAQDIDSLAYTAGRQIVFGQGGFEPQTHSGRSLLAHELAHVVQQGKSSPAAVQRKPKGADADPPFDAKSAKMRATELAKWIREHGQVSEEVRSAVAKDLPRLAGAVRRTYIREIAPALRDVQDTETLYMLGESVVPPHEISLFPLDEEMARDPFYKSNDELGIAPRREEPQRSQNDQDVPRYLRPLDARLGKNFVRTVAMSAEKAGPLKELKEEFPVLPLREDVPVDIPYLDPTQRFPEETTVADGNAPGGFRVIGPPHGKFQIPSRLPGGYELVAYNPSKRKVLIGFGEAGYVLFDRDFAALFGDEGMVSDFIGETEQSVEFRHDHALALVLGRVVLEVAVNSLMFLGPEAGGLADEFLGEASTEIATGDALGE
jgi:hypothetical protein